MMRSVLMSDAADSALLKNSLDVSVILPTYNEAGNIGKIVPEITETLRENNLTGEIVVVDDDSPDGTGAIAGELSANYPVRVSVRKGERGLATAVLKGFALSRGRVCVVMDADLSHPVKRLPDMVQPILEGKCDMTVGSRYVEGGGSTDWPLLRRMISRASGLAARGVVKLSDPTSGFMAVRRSLLTEAHLDPIGWKIVLETAVKLNPRLLEVPIVFADRFKGKSKLSFSVQYDYLRHLARLYQYKYRTVAQFAKFGTVGLSGVVLDTLVLVTSVELLHFDPRLAAVVAFLAAVSWNYSLNRVWTFQKARGSIYSYITFVLVACGGLGIRVGTMHLLLEHGGMKMGRFYVIASLVGLLLGSLFNFFGSKYISFSRRT
jgi:dolichol-phosphate mannosyltransferase